MYSMTGFGRGTAERDGRQLTVELKSVNHRFLDLSFRMPQALWPLEGALRAALSERLNRGHVDITVRYSDAQADAGGVTVNMPLAMAYKHGYRRLADGLKLKGKPRLRDVALLPGVLAQQEAPQDEELLKQMTLDAAQQALDALVAARLQEGQALKDQLTGCLHALTQLRTQMAEAAQGQPQMFLERLKERLSALQQDGMDPQRLAQEAALQADRCAVDEELKRLEAHLQQLADLLNQQGPVGRKLDFLVQEIHRELNTIGSKSQDITLTQLMLSGKNELEKLREQSQNIE